MIERLRSLTPSRPALCCVWLEVDGEAVVADEGGTVRWRFADSVRDCCSFGSERVVCQAEPCSGLVDGAFGVAELGGSVACGAGRVRVR